MSKKTKKPLLAYKYRAKRLVAKKDVQRVGMALDDLAQKNGGLSPGALVEVATDEDSLFHKYFEWDDTTAGAAFRPLAAANALVAPRPMNGMSFSFL